MYPSQRRRCPARAPSLTLTRRRPLLVSGIHAVAAAFSALALPRFRLRVVARFLLPTTLVARLSKMPQKTVAFKTSAPTVPTVG